MIHNNPNGCSEQEKCETSKERRMIWYGATTELMRRLQRPELLETQELALCLIAKELEDLNANLDSDSEGILKDIEYHLSVLSRAE